jgi:hypothetical protein
MKYRTFISYQNSHNTRVFFLPLGFVRIPRTLIVSSLENRGVTPKSITTRKTTERNFLSVTGESMKNKRSFMFVLGMLALTFGITVSGCDNGSTETSTNAISLGENISETGTVSGMSGGPFTFTNFHRMGDSSGYYYELTDAGFSSVTVAADGSFTLNLGTPNAGLESYEEDLNVSPGDAKFFEIAGFATTDGSTPGKMLSRKKGTQQVVYLYADKGAALSGGFITGTVNLSRGWNMVIEDSAAEKIFAGSVDGFNWVIEDYAGK